MKECSICGMEHVEQHHIIYRSKCQAMKKAEINHIYLCPEHHRGENGVHGKYGHELDIALKMQLQDKLFNLFSKEAYTKKEIKELLKISNADVDRLVKIVSCKDRKYERIDIVRSALGGMLYVD